MATDIHIILEKKIDKNKREETKGRIELLYVLNKMRVEDLTTDEETEMNAILDSRSCELFVPFYIIWNKKI